MHYGLHSPRGFQGSRTRKVECGLLSNCSGVVLDQVEKGCLDRDLRRLVLRVGTNDTGLGLGWTNLKGSPHN